MTCSFCGREDALIKGLCRFHYYRSRAGIPLDQPRQNYPWRTGKRKRNAPGEGGWYINSEGYVQRNSTAEEARANGGKRKTILQHRAVMEEVLGRPLLKHEKPHHLNGVRHDNRPENLELWSTHQPAGQRVEDKADWALEILRLYRPGVLTEEARR